MTFEPFHRGGSGEPLLLIHGFTDTWRTWELVLPFLERDFDVLAPTLPGHAGGPPLPEPLTATAAAEFLESLLDDAGWERPLVAGNSLGGWVALQLASRQRARAVVAFAPAGDPVSVDTLPYFRTMHRLVQRSATDDEGPDRELRARPGRAARASARRRRAVRRDAATGRLRGAARLAARHRSDRLPVRIVWGVEDAILPWPRAAQRYRRDLPQADWIELDGVGHAPQLDVPAVAAALIREPA